MNWQKKNVLSCFWSMFSTNFGYNTTKTGKCVKELSISFQNRIEKLLLVRFLLPLLFGQMVEKLLVLFGSHCNISNCIQHYVLKFSIHTKFDTLISNLNSYVQYKIVMTSWWRNIRKISKTISSVSSNPHIYRFSVSNYFLFGRYFNCSILFRKLHQKSRIFER